MKVKDIENSFHDFLQWDKLNPSTELTNTRRGRIEMREKNLAHTYRRKREIELNFIHP